MLYYGVLVRVESRPVIRPAPRQMITGHLPNTPLGFAYSTIFLKKSTPNNVFCRCALESAELSPLNSPTCKIAHVCTAGEKFLKSNGELIFACRYWFLNDVFNNSKANIWVVELWEIYFELFWRREEKIFWKLEKPQKFFKMRIFKNNSATSSV